MYLHDLYILSPAIILLSAISLLLILKTYLKDNIIINSLTILSCIIVAFFSYQILSVLIQDDILLSLHERTRYYFISSPHILLCNNSIKINVLSLVAIIAIHLFSVALLFAYYPFLKNKSLNSNFQILLLFSLLGMTILLCANDFLIFYIGLELQSLALYSMAAIDRDTTKSSEAGLKYFVLGSIASCIFLYGVSLLYGYTGTINFDILFAYANSINLDNCAANNISNLAVNVGVIFIVSSLLFKIAAVPFHMWISDVYEGSPIIVTSFFAIVAKFTAVIVLINILFAVFSPWKNQLQNFLLILSIASIAVGSFGAIIQKNIKRLLAYSAIGQVGFILLGMACYSVVGLKASLSYIIVYGITSLGAFLCFMLNRQRYANSISYNINELIGLSKNEPFIAFSLMIFLLSFAGIPPFAMFFTKLNIFTAAIDAQHYSYAIIGILITVVSTYYYLNIVKIMYFDQPPIDMIVTKIRCRNVLQTKFIITICLLFNIFYIILPNEVFNYIFCLIDSLRMFASV